MILKELESQTTFPLYRIAFRSEKAPIRYGMYNFQKLSETTSLRCNNFSENSVLKRHGYSDKCGELSGTVETFIMV
jgi:hypothetical protein